MSKRKTKNNQRKKNKQIKKKSVSPTKDKNQKSTIDFVPTEILNSDKKKDPSYKSSLFWGAIGLIASVIAILIGIYISNESTTEIVENSNQNTKEVVENSNQNTEEVNTNIENLPKEIIEEMKKNPELFQSQLKQPVLREEYERDKAVQEKRYEEDKKIQDEFQRKIIDSVLAEKYKIVIKTIKNISGSKWAELFDGGYAIFKIGTERKLFISAGSENSNLEMSWGSVKINSIDNENIMITIPDIIAKSHEPNIFPNTYKNTQVNIMRSYDLLNHIRRLNFPEFSMYSGLIADNENGIIGIIAFSSKIKSAPKEKLIDFNALQKYTSIDFYSNNSQNNIN